MSNSWFADDVTILHKIFSYLDPADANIPGEQRSQTTEQHTGDYSDTSALVSK